MALEKLGAVFNQVAFPLQYTPRKFVIHPETNNLILIETDHNAYTEATKAQRKQQMAEVVPSKVNASPSPYSIYELLFIFLITILLFVDFLFRPWMDPTRFKNFYLSSVGNGGGCRGG